jgi:hypothetical protein
MYEIVENGKLPGEEEDAGCGEEGDSGMPPKKRCKSSRH